MIMLYARGAAGPTPQLLALRATISSEPSNAALPCRGQSLIQISKNVFDVLDAYRQADGFGRDTDLALLFLGELAMGGGSGMTRQ